MAKFEAMVVKAELDTVRNEIRKCIRDGVVIKMTYSESHEPISLDEYKEFETRFRSIWGTTVSIIEATYLTPQMTELRLLPVMGIYHDEETYGVWRTLRLYFKQQELNDEKETLSTPYELREVAESVAIEKRLREPTPPKLGDEQEFKNQWREFYKANKVHNRQELDADSGRFYTADEIEIEVGQDWRREQEQIKALQERWHEIHSFDGMTLREATKRYFMQNIQSEPATIRAQAQAAPSEPAANELVAEQSASTRGKDSKARRILGLRIEYLIFGIIVAIVISLASLLLFPDWAHSVLNLVILFAVAFAAATAVIANARKAYE